MLVVVEKDLTTGFVKVYGGFYSHPNAEAWALEYSKDRPNYDYVILPIAPPPGLDSIFYE